MVRVTKIELAKALGLSVSRTQQLLREAGVSLGREGSVRALVSFLLVFDSRGSVDVRDLRRMREVNMAERREKREALRARKKRDVPVQFRKSFEHDDGFVEDVVIEADDSFQGFDFE